jgi:hypothetical protein
MRLPCPHFPGSFHLEGIAVDGKTVRDVPGGLHLLEAYAHQAQVVLAQEAVAQEENEIVVAPRILQALDLQEKVVTGDAISSQQVLEQGGDYFWMVKDNQPTLKKRHRAVVYYSFLATSR